MTISHVGFIELVHMSSLELLHILITHFVLVQFLQVGLMILLQQFSKVQILAVLLIFDQYGLHHLIHVSLRSS
jgi:hypothetical protein